MKETGKKWWKAAGIRAMKTVAQTAIGCIGASAVLSDVNWAIVASAAVFPRCQPADQRGRAAGGGPGGREKARRLVPRGLDGRGA